MVPVKRLQVAKTRLRAGSPGVRTTPRWPSPSPWTPWPRRAAAPRRPGCWWSPTTRRPPPRCAPLGALVVPDEPDAGLNPALAYGARRAAELDPAAGVALLSADLPALRAGELTAALDAAAGQPPRRFVADAAGTGTTLLAAARRAGWTRASARLGRGPPRLRRGRR